MRLLLLLASLFVGQCRGQDLRVLEVGIERIGEMLSLTSQSNSVVYKIQGTSQSNTYEIKISYPASIPTKFFIKLLEHNSYHNRRLLDVEKIIFSAEDHIQEREVHVLVKAEPAGVVAKRGLKDQPLVVYNILCERVYFNSIPQQACWIGFLVTAAIITSFVIAKHLSQLVSKLK